VQHIGIAKNEDELDELKRLANEILKQLKYERSTSPGQRELFSDNEETDSAPYDSGTERVLEEGDGVRLVSLVNENRVIDGPFEVVEWIFRKKSLFAQWC
jgi:hypothetical protein